MSADMLASMWEKHRNEFETSFDEAWAAIKVSVEQLESDPVAQKLKTFRDKYHAHLEMSPLGADPAPFEVGSLGLTYNDLLAFADQYMEPTFELNRIITGTAHSVTEFTEAHSQYGSEMWHILAGVEPGNRG